MPSAVLPTSWTMLYKAARNTEVETTIETGRVPWTFTESRKVRGLSPKPAHRPCLTPIPRQIRRFFFETVQDKSTDMDAPEPEWKCLSGFAVKKGRPEPAGRGITDRLIVPRPTAMNNSPVTPETGVPPVEMPEDPTIPDANEASEEHQQDPPPTHIPTTPLHGPQPEQIVPVARQTRSGRVIRNTPRYEQSINQRDQGLVAWEVLLDQDDREDIPTAKSQYTIQKAMENPMAFAATDNPDILYWDQAMKAIRESLLKRSKSNWMGTRKWATTSPSR